MQLPEYLRDYTYHGYTSPEVCLAANYSALLERLIFFWAIGVVGLVAVAGVTGWSLRRVGVQRAVQPARAADDLMPWQNLDLWSVGTVFLGLTHDGAP